ncbi:tellurium resistance protein TerC [Henriciella mobilis]|uniref:TerC family protein n=1 Tax=Henriciella mobilis TaxID=2305467 RepID=UPI000E6657AE|nr:tellurium resistance protein TerC [Henriciella mobilis]RIJ15114.1 tellurium resistance protein TerC [Henriciella mobilis]RIJ20284.1 tellurium resistance protein TerC [Henriciella mobilis]
MPEIFGDLFTVGGFFTLLMLLMLQAVLGFDNLLYIAIESKRVGEKAAIVRRWGIGLAMLFRIVLLIIIVSLFGALAEPLFTVAIPRVLDGEFTLQSIVTLAGGGFIIYTAVKEITHLLTVDDLGHHGGGEKKSVMQAITMIVAMNLVFSFDSILSAMAIANVKETVDGVTETRYQVTIMTVAIVSSGVVMMLMADYVAEFLKRNRMYEVLGLFILFLVGVLLVTEGAHLAHMHIFTFPIDAMSKSSFYLVVGVLVITDIISTKFQKRLWAQREAELRKAKAYDAAEARSKQAE